ncbi:glutathione S-transferase family protein [Teichococcus vastitatis]|jgi:glutathione S-transferase|uniref:Glutathione S-transferase family protein n=1 Tax=Teichococcus vastitatis TaxID=2307076 RepID=A0ABS9WBM7_9PROT|nr:glutathione S-transferase family protein [Pseudoroseomonas vastitatis]MCI0756708.1 glutathione S-transferase family protein [Pseudoroseomonas vastitatis]
MALTIYGVLRSRATRTVWLARELGLAFEHVPVIQSYRLPDPAAADAPFNTASPDFLALNPNGRVPVIADDGLVLYESLAINLYLARKHGGELAPRDAVEDALMSQWAFWAATEVEPFSLQIQTHRPAGPKHDAAKAAAAAATLARPFAALDTALQAGGGWLVGGRFTVADLNAAEILRYAQGDAALFQAYPAVGAWIAACQSRPAFQAMMAEREKEPA